MTDPSIILFGAGNMGGAILSGWLSAAMAPERFTIVDPFLQAAPAGVRLLREPPAGEAFDVVLLGFKPQQFSEAVGPIAPLVTKDTLVLSILAGVDLATLRQAFPAAAAVVRLMPNLAAALGKSPIGMVGEGEEAQTALAERLMAPLGQAEWLQSEAQMDLVTALGGSGPAFVYRFIDALATGAEALGLPRDQADRLAMSMVEGAAALAAASPDSPRALADRVASPGGTTREGLNVLDADNRLFLLIEDTLRAARDRSAEMTREARNNRTSDTT